MVERLSTPWQAGGLAPAELPAHRIYLRQLADTLAASLSDALVRHAAEQTVTLPLPLEDELSAHLALLQAEAAKAEAGQADGDSAEARHAEADSAEGGSAEGGSAEAAVSAQARVAVSFAQSAVGRRKGAPPPSATLSALARRRGLRQEGGQRGVAKGQRPRRSASAPPRWRDLFGCCGGAGAARRFPLYGDRDVDAAAATGKASKVAAEVMGAKGSRLAAAQSVLVVSSGDEAQRRAVLVGAAMAAAQATASSSVAITSKSSDGASFGMGPVVCVRFLGLTCSSASVAALLTSLCAQLATAYGDGRSGASVGAAPAPHAASLGSPGPLQLTSLYAAWRSSLGLATAERPLLLVLDGLDALLPPPAAGAAGGGGASGGDGWDDVDGLGDADGVLDANAARGLLFWLPLHQPLPHVHLLLSCSQHLLPLLNSHIHPTSRPPAMCALPVPSTSGWHRLNAQLDECEAHHGKQLVRATCALLCAALDGLSTAELSHALSRCDAVLLEGVERGTRVPHVARVSPFRLHALLRTQLAPLLAETLAQAHGGAPLLRWRHASTRQLVARRYADDDGTLGRWHRVLADHFTAVPPPPPPGARLADGTLVSLPRERLLPEQPLRISYDEPTPPWYNRRVLRELPAHLRACGALDELAETFTTLRWLSTYLAALGAIPLVHALDEATQAAAAAAAAAAAVSPAAAAAARLPWQGAAAAGEHTVEANVAALRAVGGCLDLCVRSLAALPSKLGPELGPELSRELGASELSSELESQLASQLLARLPRHLHSSPLLDDLMLQAELALSSQATAEGTVLRPLWPCLPASRRRGGEGGGGGGTKGGGGGTRHGAAAAFLRPLGAPDGACACISAIAVDALGRTVVCATPTVLKRWDVHTAEPMGDAVPHGHTGQGVVALTLDADGSIALAGGADGAVSCWHAEGAGGLRRAHAMTSLPVDLPALAAANGESTSAGSRAVRALALSEGGVAMAIWSDGRVASWAWAGGRATLRAIAGGQLGPGSSSDSSLVRAAAIGHAPSSTGGALAALVHASSPHRFETVALQPGTTVTPPFARLYECAHPRPIDAIAVGSAGEAVGGGEAAWVVASASGSWLRLWSTRDGAPLASLAADAGWPFSSLSLRGSRLLSCSAPQGVLGLHSIAASSQRATEQCGSSPQGGSGRPDGAAPGVVAAGYGLSVTKGGGDGGGDGRSRGGGGGGGDGGVGRGAVGGAHKSAVGGGGGDGSASGGVTLTECPRPSKLDEGEQNEELEAELPEEEGMEAAAALQQQLEMLQRGAIAAQAERQLQAQKTAAPPIMSTVAAPTPVETPSTPLPALSLLSWGMDTPMGSGRSSAASDGEAGDAMSHAHGGLIVITPPMTPLGATERSQASEEDDDTYRGPAQMHQPSYARQAPRNEIVQVL